MEPEDSKENGPQSKKPPVVQPKPKPRPGSAPRTVRVTPSITDLTKKPSLTSNGSKHEELNNEDNENIDDIQLNPDSLEQFSKIDFDAVERYSMLDTGAQRQKAYLGHGKGLQQRRLPGHLAHKVGDDYYEKRKSYDPKVLLAATSQDFVSRNRSITSAAVIESGPAQTEEEREKQILAKVGVPQGGAISGLAQLFKKNSKLSRSASSGSKDRQEGPPAVKAKPNKKSSITSSPDMSRLRNIEASPRSSFKFFKKKKGRNQDGDDISQRSVDDLQSETSSLSSMSRISIKEEEDKTESPSHEPTSSPHHLLSPRQPVSTETTTGGPDPSPLGVTLRSPRDTNSSRVDSLVFKEEVPSLFNDESLLLDSELTTLLDKSKTDFNSKEKKKQEQKQEKEQISSPPAPAASSVSTVTGSAGSGSTGSGSTGSGEGLKFGGPEKPLRKTRTSKVNVSAYDRAAADAIRNVKEREKERERGREEEKKKKDKGRLVLFEEETQSKEKIEEKKEDKMTSTIDKAKSLFDDDLFQDSKEKEGDSKSKSTTTATSTSASLFDGDLFDDKSDLKDDEDISKESLVKKKETEPNKDIKSIIGEREKSPLLSPRRDTAIKKDGSSLFGDDEKFGSKLTGSPSFGRRKNENKLPIATAKLIAVTDDPLSNNKLTTPTTSPTPPSPKAKKPPPKPKPKRINVPSSPASVSPLSPLSPADKNRRHIEEKDDKGSESDKGSEADKGSDKADKISESSKTSEGGKSSDTDKESGTNKGSESSSKGSGTDKGSESVKVSLDDSKSEERSETKNKKEIKEEEDVPAWKKRLEERRRQKEKEEKKQEDKKQEDKKQEEEEVPAWKKRLEERRKQREGEGKQDKKEEIPSWKKRADERRIAREKEEEERKQAAEAAGAGNKIIRNEKTTSGIEGKKTDIKEENKMEDSNKKKNEDEEIPPWKKRLEERRRQREAETTGTAATGGNTKKDELPSTSSSKSKQDELKQDKDKKDENEDVPGWKKRLEVRKKQKDEVQKPTDEEEGSDSTKETTPDTVQDTSKIKDKPKLSPILIAPPTKEEDNKATPKSAPPTNKETSPIDIDPSLPQWKKDLILKRRAGGGPPPSPRKQLPSDSDKKGEGVVPAWKKELLAKRKDPEVSSPSKKGAREKEVPSFMKEFQMKKRT